MKNSAVRLTLLILFVAAAGATGYFIWTTEARIRQDAATARDFDRRAVDATHAAVELRAAQQAYVAAGQGDDFWIKKVSAAAGQLASAVGALRVNAAAPRAQTALETTLATLRDFEQMDARARDYTVSGHRLLASDLIFSDGLEMTGAMVAALAEARFAELEQHDRATASLRRPEFLAAAGCAAFALLIMIALVPVRSPAHAAPDLPALHPHATSAAFLTADDLSGLDKIDDALDLAFAHAAEKAGSPVAPAVEKVASPEPVNLSSIAAVCTDLARVVDTLSLPAILERTAAALDAPGIVLWVADPDGRELAPIVAHGYGPQVLSRLGIIARDDENATAAAFRTGLVQTVKGDAVSNGAIAAPLVTPRGAVGVMAAEVRGDGEQQAAKLAAAAIVAAQLATLVGPPASRAHSKGVAGA